MNLSDHRIFQIKTIPAVAAVAIIATSGWCGAQSVAQCNLRRDLLARTTADEALRHGRIGTLAFVSVARRRAEALSELPVADRRKRLDALRRDYRTVADRVDRAAKSAFADTTRGVTFRSGNGMNRLRAQVLESLRRGDLPGHGGQFVRELNSLLAAGRIELGGDRHITSTAVARKSDGLDLLRRRGIRAIRGIIDSGLDHGLGESASKILEPLSAGLGLDDTISDIIRKGRSFQGLHELGKLLGGAPDGRGLQEKITRFVTDKVGGALRAKGREAFVVAFHDASEAVDIVSHFLGNKKLAADIRRFGTAALAIAESIQAFRLDEIGASVLTGNILGGVMKLFGSVFGSGKTFEDIIQEQLTEIRKQIDQVRTEMHERFDRIELQLDRLHELLQTRFEELRRGQETILGEIRAMRDEVVRGLRRTEIKVDGLISWEVMKGYYLAQKTTRQISEPGETRFGTARDACLLLADEGAKMLCRPNAAVDSDRVAAELSRRWGENLNYLADIAGKRSNRRLASITGLSDPLTWSLGVDAYLELVQKWPGRITPEQVRADIKELLRPGQRLADAIQAITIRADGSPQRRFFTNLVDEYTDRVIDLEDAIGAYFAKFAERAGLAGVETAGRYELSLWHQATLDVIPESGTWETGVPISPPTVIPLAKDSPIGGLGPLRFRAPLKFPAGWRPRHPIIRWLHKLDPRTLREVTWQYRVAVTPVGPGIKTRRVTIALECLFGKHSISRRQYQSPPTRIWQTKPGQLHLVTTHASLHGPVPGMRIKEFNAMWFKPQEWTDDFTWNSDRSKILVGDFQNLQQVTQIAGERLRPLLDNKRGAVLRDIIRVLTAMHSRRDVPDPQRATADGELAVAAFRLESSRVRLTTFLKLGLSESVRDDPSLRACLDGPNGGAIAGVASVTRELEEYRRSIVSRWDRQLPRPLSRALRDARTLEQSVQTALRNSAKRGGEPHWFIQDTIDRLRFFDALIERGVLIAGGG